MTHGGLLVLGPSVAAPPAVRRGLRLKLITLRCIDWLGSLLGRPIPVRYHFAGGAMLTFTPTKGSSLAGREKSVAIGNAKWSLPDRATRRHSDGPEDPDTAA
jgi:hypothetical protein